MLKMRLQRIGRKNDPSYRVVVVDSRQGPKSGKYVDLLGSYSPKADQVQIDGDRAKDWIGKGVQVSPTVHNILVGQKVIDGKKVNVLPKKSPIVSEEDAAATEESAPEAEAAEATDEADAPAEETKEDAPAEKEETPAETADEEEKPSKPSADAETSEDKEKAAA